MLQICASNTSDMAAEQTSNSRRIEVDRTGREVFRSVEKPFFSVIIPFLDSDTIEQTLCSVFGQSCRSFEVIIVHDGSSSSDKYRLSRFASRVIQLTQEHSGPGIARNLGAFQARGKWLAFMDADDLWAPDHLATLMTLIDVHPACDLVASSFQWRRDNLVVHTGASRKTPQFRLVDYLTVRSARQLVLTSATAVRADAFRISGGFCSAWPGEDSDLWLRLALRGPFAISSRVTVIYMQNRNGLSLRRDCTKGGGYKAECPPLIATLDQALCIYTAGSRLAELSAFRDRALLIYSKNALFRGDVELAQTYLLQTRSRTLRRTFYWTLTSLPGMLVHRAAMLYSRTKYLILGAIRLSGSDDKPVLPPKHDRNGVQNAGLRYGVSRALSPRRCSRFLP